jgi:multisubunit Na+/H+ antiporter MnhB subunit
MQTNEGTKVAQPRRMLRSIVAVIAGLVFIVIVSTLTDVLMHATGIFPPWFTYMPDSLFLLALAYRSLFSILGGYITALLAPNRPMVHALILGGIGVVLSVAGAAATWNKGREFGPKWYPIALIILALPLAWLGGRIRLAQLSAKTD